MTVDHISLAEIYSLKLITTGTQVGEKMAKSNKLPAPTCGLLIVKMAHSFDSTGDGEDPPSALFKISVFRPR